MRVSYDDIEWYRPSVFGNLKQTYVSVGTVKYPLDAKMLAKLPGDIARKVWLLGEVRDTSQDHHEDWLDEVGAYHLSPIGLARYDDVTRYYHWVAFPPCAHCKGEQGWHNADSGEWHECIECSGRGYVEENIYCPNHDVHYIVLVTDDSQRVITYEAKADPAYTYYA